MKNPDGSMVNAGTAAWGRVIEPRGLMVQTGLLAGSQGCCYRFDFKQFV
jgi:hypothetical protein